MIDPNQQQFFTSEVGEVVGISDALMQSWLARGYFTLPSGAALGSGHSRLFAARTVIELAIAKELTRYGMTPTTASKIAQSQPRYADGTLRKWVTEPTGMETRKLQFDDLSKHFSMFGEDGCDIDPQADFTHHKSVLVIGLGAIAKTVLEKLEAILERRRG